MSVLFVQIKYFKPRKTTHTPHTHIPHIYTHTK